MLTYNDLMAAVGSFVVTWSTLEHALSEAIMDDGNPQTGSNHSVKRSFEDRLERWCILKSEGAESKILEEIVNQANDLRKFRNLVIHGVAGGHSVPDDGSEPHIRCRVGGWGDPKGKVRKITVAELRHHTEAADACRRAFGSPHAFNYRL